MAPLRSSHADSTNEDNSDASPVWRPEMHKFKEDIVRFPNSILLSLLFLFAIFYYLGPVPFSLSPILVHQAFPSLLISPG